MVPSARAILATALAVASSGSGGGFFAAGRAPRPPQVEAADADAPHSQGHRRVPAPDAVVAPSMQEMEEEPDLIETDRRPSPPPLPGDLEWVTSAPVSLDKLKGHVVLFASPRSFVEKAVGRLGLQVPVASDGRRSLWRTWGLHGWPTTFLLDAGGSMAHMHQGEFSARSMEKRIRALLNEARPGFALPPEATIPAPENPYVPECGFVTPEIVTAAGRDYLLNPEGYKLGETIVYADPGFARREGTIYLRGPWSWLRTGIQRGWGGAPASIGITYTGKEVYAVLANAGRAPQEIEVRQDGKPLTETNRGQDILIGSDGRSIIRLTDSGLHYLVVNPEAGRHDLELFPSSPFFLIHNFSFSNRCQTAFPHR